MREYVAYIKHRNFSKKKKIIKIIQTSFILEMDMFKKYQSTGINELNCLQDRGADVT